MSTLLNEIEPEICFSQPVSLPMRWYFGFFIVSGFCGLVYEVIWLRLAMASFGVTTALVSIVVSMFMAGLGLGSWGAGLLTQRLEQSGAQRMLRYYAIAEFLIGISSLAVPLQLKFGRLLLQHTGSFGIWQSSRYYLLAGLWIAVVLVPWCSCMGATFPLLMSVLRKSAGSGSERSFSYLYLANILGALLGTITSAFILIELLGFQGTLYIAGALNLTLALFAFGLSFRLDASASSSVSRKSVLVRTSREDILHGFPNSAALLLLFTSGLVSMGLEVVWIRQFTLYLGNVVYAFAGILAIYLLATVIGSRDYRSWAESHSASQSASAWSLLALFVVVPVAAADPSRLSILGVLGLDGLRVFSIMLFCAMTGFLTPLLVDAWSAGDPERAGNAYAVNILGCIAGPLVVGFGLLPRIGERWSTIVLAAPLFAIGLFLALRASSESTEHWARRKPLLKLACALVVAILLIFVSHDYETKYSSREVRRDYTATVIGTGKGFDRQLLVNGLGMTKLTPITKFMVHLPLALMSKQPNNGLVICFGMGTSFRSMLSWGVRTTAVELVPSVPGLFSYYHADAPRLVSSPLARIIIDDGRRFLDGSTERYDVIVVDPPPPPAAPGSSLLYSRDFFDVIKRHLQKDGILQIWHPAIYGDAATTASIAKALMQSFPYVRAFLAVEGSGIYFLASMDPLPRRSSSELAAHLPSAAASDFVEWGPKSDPQQQFELVVPHELNLNEVLAKDPKVPVIRDDQPINEYYLLRSWLHTYR